MAPDDRQGRTAQARQVANELLDALEGGDANAERVLMGAQRLARLLRDSDAQQWLLYEMSGYPERLDTTTLGTAARYLSTSPRFFDNGTMLQASLPQLEAQAKAEEQALGKLATPSVPPTENYLAAGATAQLIDKILASQANAKRAYASAARTVSAIRAAVHRYVTECAIALELGDVAEGIFEVARARVDNFVRAHCPQAAEQLVAIADRMKDGTPEARSHALTSCRRVLVSVADAVYPPRDEPHIDPGGRARKVGRDQFVNRLLAFLEPRVQSEGTREMATAELEHLAARLTAAQEKASKGVHTDVSEDEARLTVIHTYLFLGEIALAASRGSAQPTAKSTPPERVGNG